MTFDAIPVGSDVFIDANCLIYQATGDPTYGAPCLALFQRIERSELQGFCSAHVLAEMSHRLMTLEAASNLGRPLSGLVNWLRRHPQELSGLSVHRRAIDDLSAIPVQILPVVGSDVSRAADLSVQHQLLTNDAIIVSVMQSNNLTLLASGDPDFDRVPGIVRYSPT